MMPTPQEFFDRVAALTREGRPFAVATVVGRRQPVSAHLGDRAIVFPDGRMDGFVGGACAREIVRTQALDALRSRTARLVSIRPDAGGTVAAGHDHVVVPMTCASEGAVDVYVEPVFKPRTLVVAGATPVADALARLGRAMHYDVVRVVDGAERRDLATDAGALGVQLATLEDLATVAGAAVAAGGGCAAVVASQGHYDEPALEALLRAGVPYVGLVASRKRGGGIRTWLEESDVPNLDRLRNPAGLDIGGRGPEEVAIAILAEIVQQLASSGVEAAAAAPSASSPSTIADAGVGPPGRPAQTGRMLQMATAAVPGPRAGAAIDPVCHMEVTIEGASHVAEVEGVTYYFCCPGCRARFVKDPQRYLSSTS